MHLPALRERSLHVRRSSALPYPMRFAFASYALRYALRASPRPPAPEDYFYSLQENVKIQKRRKIFDIEKVVLYFFQGIVNRCSMLVINLGPPGNSRPYRVSERKIRNLCHKFLHLLLHQRPRANKTHLSFEDIPHLRNLIYTQFSYNFSNPRNP